VWFAHPPHDLGRGSHFSYNKHESRLFFNTVEKLTFLCRCFFRQKFFCCKVFNQCNFIIHTLNQTHDLGIFQRTNSCLCEVLNIDGPRGKEVRTFSLEKNFAWKLLWNCIALKNSLCFAFNHLLRLSKIIIILVMCLGVFRNDYIAGIDICRSSPPCASAQNESRCGKSCFQFLELVVCAANWQSPSFDVHQTKVDRNCKAEHRISLWSSRYAS